MTMTKMARVAMIYVVAMAFTPAAMAVEDIVKPAATPMPAAGPTIAAATEFCGDIPAKADDLFTRYSTQQGLKEVYKSVDYIAFSDDEKNSTQMYTFTVKGHPAHPAAVCRRIMKDGDQTTIKMVVICEGEKDACAKLQNDFNVMTAKMQLEVNDRIKAAGGK